MAEERTERLKILCFCWERLTTRFSFWQLFPHTKKNFSSPSSFSRSIFFFLRSLLFFFAISLWALLHYLNLHLNFNSSSLFSTKYAQCTVRGWLRWIWLHCNEIFPLFYFHSISFFFFSPEKITNRGRWIFSSGQVKIRDETDSRRCTENKHFLNESETTSETFDGSMQQWGLMLAICCRERGLCCPSGDGNC